jgi:hypothetical protein
MARQMINREQLNSQVSIAIPQVVKESGNKVDHFLGSAVNSISKVAFRLGAISPFRMTLHNTTEFPFSGDLSEREKTKLSADLNGVSSGGSW